MPESPEVQAFVEFVYEHAIGRSIRSVEIVDYRALKTREPAPAELAGCHVSSVLRFGKYVDIDAGQWHLVISFGRHGWATWRGTDVADDAAEPTDGPSVVARVRFDDGAGFDLTDAGQFRSAAVYVVAEAADVPGIAKLGTDPADPTFTRGDFERAVDGRRKQIKALLQEQESFAGVGNAYSDEILHVAQISPVMHASELSDDERERLYDATRQVILDAIDARRGIPIDQLKGAKVASMRVHGRADQFCPVCGSTVQSLGTGDSTGQYCPGCQTGGATL